MTAPRIRVLFVDDEAELLGGLRRRLRRAAELDPVYALGADEAMLAIDREPFEVVVSDLRMPGVDGPRLLAVVAERSARCTRLLLTGCAQPGLERHFGVAHGVLGKPCALPELRSVLERARRLRSRWPSTPPPEPAAHRRWWQAVTVGDDSACLQIATPTLERAAPELSALHLQLRPIDGEAPSAWMRSLGPLRVAALILAEACAVNDAQWGGAVRSAGVAEAIARRSGLSSHGCMLAFMTGALCPMARGWSTAGGLGLGEAALAWNLPDEVVDAMLAATAAPPDTERSPVTGQRPALQPKVSNNVKI